MKKLLLIPLLAITMFACKKENAVENNAVLPEKKSIEISVADFIMQEGNLRSANGRAAASGLERNANLPNIFYVYYMAFSNDGKRVSYIIQDSLNYKSSFGVIKDSLYPGTYDIVLIASEKELTVNADSISKTYFGPRLSGGFWFSMGDAFYKKIPVTISDSSNINNLDVTLDRVASMVELNILDALPANDPKGDITIKLSPIIYSFYVGSGLTGKPYPNGPDSPPYIGTRINQHTFREYMLGSNNTYTLTIGYRDKITGANLFKTIENIKCTANKKTIISGYLYGAPGLKIALNQAWGADSSSIQF